MVRFYVLCGGKIMIRKTNVCFGFCVELSSFFAKVSVRVI